MLDLPVFKKYNHPDLVALDILMQKADAFNEEYHVSTHPTIKNLIFLTFINGSRFLHLSGFVRFFVASSEEQIPIIENSFDNLHIYDRATTTSVILVLEQNSKTIDWKNNHLILNVQIILEELNRYSPYHYERLLKILGDKKTTLKYLANDNKDSIDIPSNIEQISSADGAKDLSQKHANEFKDYLKKDPANCVFILGNGVSIPLGADSWNKLISNLIDYLTPFYIKETDKVIEKLSKSNYLISSFVKSMFETKGQDDIYLSGLKYCIYRKFNKSMLKENSLLKAIALAKIKYPNLMILTYNYDNFLEQQITECNPSIKIKSFSGKTYMKHLNDSIIHLHGTITIKSIKLDPHLVLTDEDYFNAYLNNNSNWAQKAQYNCLSNKKCLFIGSSMSDLFQLSIIERVKRAKGDEWSCYALMSFQGMDKNDNEKNNLIRFYKNKGIRIIFTDDFDSLSSALNEITGCVFASGTQPLRK